MKVLLIDLNGKDREIETLRARIKELEERLTERILVV